MVVTLLCCVYTHLFFISLSHFHFPYLFSQLYIYLFPSKWTVVPKLVSRLNSSLPLLLTLSLSLVSPHDNDNDNEFNYIIVISVNCFPSTDAGNAKTYIQTIAVAQKVNIIEYNMQTAITFTCFFFALSISFAMGWGLNCNSSRQYYRFFCCSFSNRPTETESVKKIRKVAFGRWRTRIDNLNYWLK